MSKAIPFLVFLLVLFFPQASNAQYFPDTAWTRCYGGTLSDFPLSIQQTSDAGYIIMGTSSSNDGDLDTLASGYKAWILKLDSTGNIEWQRAIQNNGYASPQNIRQTADGGYILGGDKFTKLQANGGLDWEVNIPCHFVFQTMDGGYALMHNNAGSLTTSQLTKLTPNNIVDWSNSMNGLEINSIEETIDSCLLLTGLFDVVDPPFKFAECVKIDRYGNTVMGHIGEFGTYFSGKQTLDEKFILTGYENEWSMPGYASVTKADSDLVWQHQYHDVWDYDVVQNIDSTFVFCGKDTFDKAVISKTNSLGNQPNIHYFGGTGEDIFKRLIKTADSGYMAIGHTYSSDGDVWNQHGSADIWLVKFKQDTSVHVPPPITTMVNKLSRINDVRVYPTITNGIVNVVLPQGYEQASIKAYSIMGQPVNVNSTSVGAKRTISIANQPAGQYILEVRQGTERKSFIITLNP